MYIGVVACSRRELEIKPSGHIQHNSCREAADTGTVQNSLQRCQNTNTVRSQCHRREALYLFMEQGDPAHYTKCDSNRPRCHE